GKAELARRKCVCIGTYWNFLLERDRAGLESVEDEVGCHDFGQRGGMPRLVLILGIKHLPARGIEQQRRPARRSARPSEHQCQRDGGLPHDHSAGPSLNFAIVAAATDTLGILGGRPTARNATVASISVGSLP